MVALVATTRKGTHAALVGVMGVIGRGVMVILLLINDWIRFDR